jgi:hypothetical protein
VFGETSRETSREPGETTMKTDRSTRYAFIRPVHTSDGRLISLALCRSYDILQDADVHSHFPANGRGADLKAMAVENGLADCEDNVRWAAPIFVAD